MSQLEHLNKEATDKPPQTQVAWQAGDHTAEYGETIPPHLRIGEKRA